MLTRDGIFARYILALCFFFASGTELVTGWAAGICGILGTMELATALMRYSPLYDMYNHIKSPSED